MAATAVIPPVFYFRAKYLRYQWSCLRMWGVGLLMAKVNSSNRADRNHFVVLFFVPYCCCCCCWCCWFNSQKCVSIWVASFLGKVVTCFCTSRIRGDVVHTPERHAPSTAYSTLLIYLSHFAFMNFYGYKCYIMRKHSNIIGQVIISITY